MRATLALGVLILLASPTWARTWTDATGTFTIEADLVSVENDAVVLLRDSDKKQIRIPLAKLSKADQDFAKSPTGAAPKEENVVSGDDAAPNKPLTKEEIQAAEKTVNDLFKDDIANARTPKQKIVLADRLVTTAKAEQERANRYALFTKAAELGANLGESELVIEAMDLADGVQFFPDVWVKRLEALASHNADNCDDVFDKMDALIQKCYEADDYDSAGKLAGVLTVFARVLHSPDLQNRATFVISDVADARKEFTTHVVGARAVLKNTPADPASNLVVGKFLCFVRKDWDRGIPMLALGSDSELQSLAVLELREQKSVADMVALGDGWLKVAIKDRAAFWYKQALPKVSGMVKLKLEKAVTSAAGNKNETRVFLSDLPEQEAKVGYGAFGKGGDLGYEDGKIILNSVPSRKGLSLHPFPKNVPAQVTYILSQGFAVLRGKVAIDDSVASNKRESNRSERPITFVITGDGKELWRSRPLQNIREFQHFEVNMNGVSKLELSVFCDSVWYAHAIWIDPVLVQRGN